MFSQGSKVGDLVSMLAIVNMSGTWDLGSHVNRPKVLNVMTKLCITDF